MKWYLQAFRKYAVFEGRAARREFWMFFLVNLIVQFIVAFMDSTTNSVIGNDVGILGILYTLAVFLPYLSLTVRRLHDTGRSGLWVLIVLVPLIGLVVLLVLLALDGQPGENAHGPNPKTTVVA